MRFCLVSHLDESNEQSHIIGRQISDSEQLTAQILYTHIIITICVRLEFVELVLLGDPKHPGRSGTGGIRRLIETNLTGLDQARRVKLSELIGRLYTLRCVAD